MTDHDTQKTNAESTVAETEMSVLCVDPDGEAADEIATALDAAGEPATVEVAASCADALAVLDARPIECIVSEFTLADGTGLELLGAVRERYGDVPFVLYTADGSEALASDALSAGVTEYVSKRREEALPRLIDVVETTVAERRSQRWLTEAEADEFRTLVDDVRDHAIFLLDPQGHVASWNSGAEHIKGYAPDEILGEHFSVFYPPDATERDKPSEMLAEARARGRTTDEGWRVTKDGTRFWANVVISALRDDDGAVRGFAKFTRDLTEQREREQQIREQRELTDRILDTVPVGVAVHAPEGDLVRANKDAQDILDMLGASDEPGNPRPEIATIHGADGEPVDGTDLPPLRVFETGEPVADMELAFEQTDGSVRWYSVNSVPMYDTDGEDVERIITTGQDITALKRRERELEEAHRELQATVDALRRANEQLEVTENRFEALTENSSVGVISIDGTSTVRFANDTIEDILGYDVEALVGESLTAVMPERFVDRHEAAIGRYIRSGERRLDWDWIELPGRHADGHEVDLGLSFGETTVDGDHLFTAVVRDITEQKERERELERRREELNELVDELERSNAELEQFAYAVSHDLKEPLRMVTSYLQLLERRYGDALDEDAEEFIDYAVDGAERMKRMIDDILEFSRVGRDKSAHEPVDCGVVLEEVREMLPGDGSVDVTVDPLPTVAGNRTQLTKVFQNLLTNAVTHCGEDVSVRVSAEREGDRWRLFVADDGPGIPPEQQEHVFELFASVGSTGGTGVGLAICKKVVEYHGGDIRVDSTPGEGTTFSFTLPTVDAVDDAADGTTDDAVDEAVASVTAETADDAADDAANDAA